MHIIAVSALGGRLAVASLYDRRWGTHSLFQAVWGTVLPNGFDALLIELDTSCTGGYVINFNLDNSPLPLTDPRDAVPHAYRAVHRCRRSV